MHWGLNSSVSACMYLHVNLYSCVYYNYLEWQHLHSHAKNSLIALSAKHIIPVVTLLNNLCVRVCELVCQGSNDSHQQCCIKMQKDFSSSTLCACICTIIMIILQTNIWQCHSTLWKATACLCKCHLKGKNWKWWKKCGKGPVVTTKSWLKAWFDPTNTYRHKSSLRLSIASFLN